MSTPVRWTDPPKPRAKHKKRSKWDEHKDKIISLFLSNTLKYTMEKMEKDHGFVATERQYNYHINTVWGIKKYEVGPPSDSPTFTKGDSSFAQALPHTAQPASVDRLDSQKRHRSLLSFQSMDSSSAKPAKKKIRFDQTANSYPGIVEDPNTQYSDFETETEGYSYTNMAQATSPKQRPDLSTSVKPLSLSEVGSNQRRASKRLSYGNSHTQSRQFMKPASTTRVSIYSTANSEYWKNLPSEEVSTGDSDGLTEINSNRPIDTFSLRELSNMEVAAAYLASLDLSADAFLIMAMLLKRAKIDPTWQRGRNRIYMLLDYAQAARLPAQLEIAHVLLEQELKKVKEPIERFLLHTSMSKIHERKQQVPLVRRELQNAVLASGVTHPADLLAQLPDKDRRLDFLTYDSVMDCVFSPHLSPDVLPDTGVYWHMPGVAMERSIEIRFLLSCPGPFEIRDERFGKNCLRNCLKWCSDQVRRMRNLPAVDRTWPFTFGSASFWVANTALFVALWSSCYIDRLDSGGATQTVDDSWSWRQEAEDQMGLSPAKLLGVLCRMVVLEIRSTTETSHLSNMGILRHAKQEFRRLSAKTDMNLAISFLKTYRAYSANHWESFRETERVLPEKAQNQFLGQMERYLRLRIPELPRASASTDVAYIPDPVAVKGILPTLASSLSSIDMTSMRNARNRMLQKADSIHKVMVDVPSAVLRSSDCRISLLSMDTLSTAFRSLNVSISQPDPHRSLRQSREMPALAEETQDSAESKSSRPHSSSSWL